MPASLRARVLATATLQHALVNMAGLSGQNLSRSRRVGRIGSSKLFSFHPPPYIHWPFFMSFSFIYFLVRYSISARDFASKKFIFSLSVA